QSFWFQGKCRETCELSERGWASRWPGKRRGLIKIYPIIYPRIRISKASIIPRYTFLATASPSLAEHLEPRPPRHQGPRPQSIHDDHIDKAEHQAPSKDKTVIRPRIARVELLDLADDAPRQHVEEVARQTLQEIPLRP